MLIDLINIKYIKHFVSIAVFLVFFCFSNLVNPIVYNYQFLPDDNYNRLYKMSYDEIDIINVLKDCIDYYKDNSPYIVTNNILTLSMVPQGRYIYCRENLIYDGWTNSEKNIYEIFYEPEYLGDYINLNPDYGHMLEYIKKSDISYIIIKKDTEIFDDSKNIYTYLYLKTNEICECFPIYENKEYVLYKF